MKKVAFSLATALALVLAMPVQGNAQGRDDPLRGGGGGQERGSGQERGGGGERLLRGEGGGGGGNDGVRVQRQNDNDRAQRRDRDSDRLFLNRGDNDDRRRAGRDRDRRDDARRVDRDDRRESRRWKRWRSGDRYRVVIVPSYSYGIGLGWCHFHRYRAAGMRAHRSVQCHYHANWRHPSIVYVAGY